MERTTPKEERESSNTPKKDGETCPPEAAPPTREEGREQHHAQIGRDETATLLHLKKVKHVILNFLIFHFCCTWKMLIKSVVAS